MPCFENHLPGAVVVSVDDTHCQAEQNSRDMEEYCVGFIFLPRVNLPIFSVDH